MHKCTSLAIHDDTDIATLLFILTSNGATDRDSGYSSIIYSTGFYLYICGVILPLCCYVCIVLLCACCTLSENDEIKLINQSSELSRLWSQFVDFSNFGTILTSWNGSNLGILVMLCGFSSLWCPFDSNWSYLGFLGIIWRTCESKCRGGSGGIFPTLFVKFCLVWFYFKAPKEFSRRNSVAISC